jgi:hypothetical protein
MASFVNTTTNFLVPRKQGEGFLDQLSSFEVYEMEAAPGNYILSKISVESITDRR